MTSPIRVALLTPSLSTGGAERHLLKLAAAVDPAEVELTIVILFRGERNELLPFAPPHVEVVEGPYRRRDPRIWPWLARVLRSREIEVAHSFLWSSDFFSAMATHLFHPATLICSERGDRAEATLPRRVLDRMITFPAATLLCANSRFGGELVVRGGCPPQKVRVIPNGVELGPFDAHVAVDLRRMFGWPERSPIVGTVSRLVPYKGVDVLLRAFASVGDDLEARCVIVGDGPERARLEALAADLNVESRVRFAGAQHPSEPWTKAIDVAVLATATDTEHCSNSILEAMTAGKPVVATRVGGNPELVVDGETGILVPPNDDQALAAALRSLLVDRERAAAFGRAARLRIESGFQMRVVAQRFTELWRSARAAAATTAQPDRRSAVASGGR